MKVILLILDVLLSPEEMDGFQTIIWLMPNCLVKLALWTKGDVDFQVYHHPPNEEWGPYTVANSIVALVEIPVVSLTEDAMH